MWYFENTIGIVAIRRRCARLQFITFKDNFLNREKHIDKLFLLLYLDFVF